jgi:integrase
MSVSGEGAGETTGTVLSDEEVLEVEVELVDADGAVTSAAPSSLPVGTVASVTSVGAALAPPILEAASADELAPVSPELAEQVAQAREYAASTRAKNTVTAYAWDFGRYEAWCTPHGFCALPANPEEVAVYLSSLAAGGAKTATVQRALAGIGWAQRAAGHDWPKGHRAIAAVMSGIRRKHGTAPTQKTAIVDDVFVALVESCPTTTLLGKRDRSMLTLGFFGAFRRTELVSLRVEDVTRERDGLILNVRRSKGDQEGRGEQKAVPYSSRGSVCPVRALDDWLGAAKITSGPLFRTIYKGDHVVDGEIRGRVVADAVKRAAERIGVDPATVAGHSLRAGFATTAARHGKSLDAIMRQTLHKDVKVARSYIRHARMFDDNAAEGLF